MDRFLPPPRPVDDATALAGAWIDFVERRHPVTGDLRMTPTFSLPSGADWAARTLTDMLLADPLFLMEVVSAIVDLSGDAWVLSSLGSGPLEDLLWLGDVEINALIEMDASASGRMREALGSVWPARLPPLSARLIERALTLADAANDL